MCNFRAMKSNTGVKIATEYENKKPNLHIHPAFWIPQRKIITLCI